MTGALMARHGGEDMRLRMRRVRWVGVLRGGGMGLVMGEGRGAGAKKSHGRGEEVSTGERPQTMDIRTAPSI